MSIKPSADLLHALGTLPADRTAARPNVGRTDAARPAARQFAPKQSMPTQADIKSGRNYRPGTFLDIYA